MARKGIDPKVKKVVHDYTELLRRDRLPIRDVFVFGSRLTRRFRRDSDIDVAVVSPKFSSGFSANKYLLRKAHELPNGDFYIEPHGFHPSTFQDENPLVWEIKKHGVKIE